MCVIHKKNIFLRNVFLNRQLLIMAIITTFVCFSCKSTPAQSEPFIKKENAESLRLAVIQPIGINIPQSQAWFLSMIQSSLTNDFNQYSKMDILERQYLDNILAEQQLSLSGYFSDDDYIKIGHLTNAQYILVGTLQKIGVNNFLLDMAITNTETGKRLASFGPKQYALSDIEGMLAPKEAAFDLMSQTGTEFTEAGRKKFFETAQASVRAETALAKGISAEKSGATLVEVMQYYYQAVDYDSKMIEAIDRLAGTNKKLTSLSQPLTVVKTGNIREDALAEIAAYRIEQENKRIDEENRKVWIQQLTDCEEYFADFFETVNAPLQLIYSPNIRVGSVDRDKETVSLQFEAALFPLEESWFKAAEQTIDTVRKALIKTGRAKDWGLDKWPAKSISSPSPFKDVRREYDIIAQLLDENGYTISVKGFHLVGGWDVAISKSYSVSFSPYFDYNIQNVIFNQVKLLYITDTLTIQIAEINHLKTETAVETGVLTISTDSVLLKKARSNEKWEKYKENYRTTPPITFEIGYVYQPDYPIGFRIGTRGFYTTWNFHLPDWQGYDFYDRKSINFTYFKENGRLNNFGDAQIFLGNKEFISFQWIAGYSINIIDNFLMIPVGIGARHALEHRLFEVGINYASGYRWEKYWFPKGKQEKGLNTPDWQSDIILEAGIAINPIKWVSLLATYRLTGWNESSYTIGASFTMPSVKK